MEVFDETVLFRLFKRNNFSYGTICSVLFFSFISLLKSIVHFRETIMQRRFIEQVESFIITMFVARSKSVELSIYFFYHFEMLANYFFSEMYFSIF